MQAGKLVVYDDGFVFRHADAAQKCLMFFLLAFDLVVTSRLTASRPDLPPQRRRPRRETAQGCAWERVKRRRVSGGEEAVQEGKPISTLTSRTVVSRWSLVAMLSVSGG